MPGRLEELKFEGAIAVLDILGFKYRMAEMDIETLRDEVVGNMIISSSIAKEIIEHDLSNFERYSKAVIRHIPINYLYFADSVIFYLPRVKKSLFDTPQDILESMIYLCCLIVARSIWLSIPLRGAIAYGECLISHDPLYFIGKPFIEANELEKKQQWAGVVLCESAESMIKGRDCTRVCQWDVPMERGISKKMFAINWPSYCLPPNTRYYRMTDNYDEFTEKVFGNNEGEIEWSKCFSQKSEKVLNMKRNTEKFFRDCNRIGASRYFGPEQRAKLLHWEKYYH